MQDKAQAKSQKPIENKMFFKRSTIFFLLLLIALWLLPIVSISQELKQPRPKIGLVLSGGGAKGFAHISNPTI